MTKSGLLNYRCSPTIHWLRDADRTILVDTDAGGSWSIRGAEAVVWDLLTLGYTSQRIARVLPLLLGQTDEEGWITLRAIVQAWEQADLLLLTAGDEHG